MSVSDRSSASFQGLALSGGGLRAAFFHIGVLARMAELDLLRGVGWISTVSGGSIIGALYYLKVKKCLEESYRGGRLAEAADYVRIVRELCDEFLAGAQQDVRSRAFGHWRSNFSGETSQLIGKLYDRFFYAPYSRGGKSPVTMRDLRIDPAVAAAQTSVRVPKLCINATVLDTGQQWVFTPEDMGALDKDSTGSKLSQMLARRHKYEDLKDEEYKDLPLGFAVAASSCVPLVFPPIWLRLSPFSPELKSMVSEIGAEHHAKPKVLQSTREAVGFELVDGGVVDNLGLVALASMMGAKGRVLVSNASAPSNATVSGRPRSGLAVGRTSLTILMSKTQQAANLQALARLALAQPEGDRDRTVEVSLAGAWKDTGAWAETDERKIKEIVELIRNVRTDLDAFSTLEAHALMYAGYVSAGHSLQSEPVGANAKWPFRGAKAKLTLKHAQKHLSASASPFKIARLTPYLLWKNREGFSILVGVMLSYLLLAQTEPSKSLLGTAANAMWTGLSLLTLVIIVSSVGFRLLVSSVMALTSWLSLALRPLLLRSRVPWAPR